MPLPGPSGPASLKTCQRACFPGAAAPRQGGDFRKLNRRKSASCGHCSFRLISPPMRFPPQAVIGGSSLDPHLRILLAATNKLVFRRSYGKRGYARLGDVSFRARRLLAARPVRKAHREKGRDDPLGKARFPQGFTRPFSCARKPQTFRSPCLTGGGCLFSPASYFANYGSRVLSTLVGVWGE